MLVLRAGLAPHTVADICQFDLSTHACLARYVFDKGAVQRTISKKYFLFRINQEIEMPGRNDIAQSRPMRSMGSLAATTLRTLMAAFLLLPLLTACAAYKVHQARDGQESKLVGANILDLIQSVGIPDRTMKIVDTGGPNDRMAVQWNFSNSDAAVDFTLILLRLKVGGAGKCSMTATVSRWGGKVLAVNFPQAHTDSIGSDYGACEPLVDEALTHRPHTPIDPTYDAFVLVGAAK